MPTIEETRKRLLGEKPAPPPDADTRQRAGEAALTQSLKETQARLLKRDPDFDPQGVQDFRLRAGFSFMDTDEERQAYLESRVGKGNVTRDSFGAWAITPEGMDRLGLPHLNKPVLLDEPGIRVPDIADLASAGPPVVGGVVGGTLGGPYAAGLGTALASGIVETIEELTGSNLEPTSAIMRRMGREGFLGAASEAVFSAALAPLGRKILAPEARRMTPERSRLAEQARDLGMQPSVSQITSAPLIGRMQSIANRIFGDPLAEKNSRAITAEMERLRQKVTGTVATRTMKRRGELDLGEKIAVDIKAARRAVSDWAAGVTRNIDAYAQNREIVPSDRLKQVAQEILDSLPKTQGGEVSFAPPELLKSLQQTLDLSDNLTLTQMQNITNRLFEAIPSEGIVPGVSGRNARLLWKAATNSYDDIQDPATRQLVTEFRKRYAKEISKFDDALIARIMKDPGEAGRIEPEMISETLFRKGRSSALNRVMKVLPERTKARIRNSAMNELLDKLVQRTEDPFTSVFNGKAFLDNLDSFGRDTLHAMFGRKVTGELYNFGRATQLVTMKQAQAGGLVAAGIATRPLQNIGRLVKLNVLSRFFNSEFGTRWLTDGLRAPRTREGAAALSRASILFSTLADEETGGPLF